PVPAADAQASSGHALRAARRIQSLRNHRLCQGVCDGLILSAHAILPSRRRRLRAAAGRTAGAAWRCRGPRPSVIAETAAIAVRTSNGLVMPEFSNTRRVRHSAAHMFDLVADVERYPEFVPLCRSLKVRKRLPEPEGVKLVVADMTVAYRFVRETFASRVTLDRPNLQILVEYLEGPFSRLENRWSFHPRGERTCEVE